MDNPPEINPKNRYIGKQFFVVVAADISRQYFTIPKTAKPQTEETDGIKNTFYILDGERIEPTLVDAETTKQFCPDAEAMIQAVLTIVYTLPQQINLGELHQS